MKSQSHLNSHFSMVNDVKKTSTYTAQSFYEKPLFCLISTFLLSYFFLKLGVLFVYLLDFLFVYSRHQSSDKYVTNKGFIHSHSPLQLIKSFFSVQNLFNFTVQNKSMYCLALFPELQKTIQKIHI